MEKEILKSLQELKELAVFNTKNVLTMREAAALLSLSMSYLYRLVCTKQIPHYKSAGGGKFTYFERKELEKWMLANRVKTSSEIEAEAVNYVVTGKRKGVANV